MGGCFLVFVFGLGFLLGFLGCCSACGKHFFNMGVACVLMVVGFGHVERACSTSTAPI